MIGGSLRLEAQVAKARLDSARLAFRLGLSGAVAAALLFAGLWMLAQLPIGPSDLVVELFTSYAPASLRALEEGILHAALVGFACGALVGLLYRAFEFIESR